MIPELRLLPCFALALFLSCFFSSQLQGCGVVGPGQGGEDEIIIENSTAAGGDTTELLPASEGSGTTTETIGECRG